MWKTKRVLWIFSSIALVACMLLSNLYFRKTRKKNSQAIISSPKKHKYDYMEWVFYLQQGHGKKVNGLKCKDKHHWDFMNTTYLQHSAIAMWLCAVERNFDGRGWLSYIPAAWLSYISGVQGRRKGAVVQVEGEALALSGRIRPGSRIGRLRPVRRPGQRCRLGSHNRGRREGSPRGCHTGCRGGHRCIWWWRDYRDQFPCDGEVTVITFLFYSLLYWPIGFFYKPDRCWAFVFCGTG